MQIVNLITLWKPTWRVVVHTALRKFVVGLNDYAGTFNVIPNVRVAEPAGGGCAAKELHLANIEDVHWQVLIPNVAAAAAAPAP